MVGKVWLIAVWVGIFTFCALFWWGAFRTVAGLAQYDPGGNVANYWVLARTDTRPITGFCASACTMRLYKARCVDRGAVLGFHRATTDLGTRIMTGMYAPPLRAWFDVHCHGATLHTLTGAQVAALGPYHLC